MRKITSKVKQMHAYYLFRKSPIPKTVGSAIENVVQRLQEHGTKESFLEDAYDFITTHYKSELINTVLRLPELFSTNLQSLWNRKGFMHCTNQNYLLAVLLIKSGHFTESDIQLRWTLVWFSSPHQYLKIKLDNDRWIAVDCWARQHGVRLGSYAHGFNTTIRRSPLVK